MQGIAFAALLVSTYGRVGSKLKSQDQAVLAEKTEEVFEEWSIKTRGGQELCCANFAICKPKDGNPYTDFPETFPTDCVVEVWRQIDFSTSPSRTRILGPGEKFSFYESTATQQAFEQMRTDTKSSTTKFSSTAATGAKFMGIGGGASITVGNTWGTSNSVGTKQSTGTRTSAGTGHTYITRAGENKALFQSTMYFTEQKIFTGGRRKAVTFPTGKPQPVAPSVDATNYKGGDSSFGNEICVRRDNPHCSLAPVVAPPVPIRGNALVRICTPDFKDMCLKYEGPTNKQKYLFADHPKVHDDQFQILRMPPGAVLRQSPLDKDVPWTTCNWHRETDAGQLKSGDYIKIVASKSKDDYKFMYPLHHDKWWATFWSYEGTCWKQIWRVDKKNGNVGDPIFQGDKVVLTNGWWRSGTLGWCHRKDESTGNYYSARMWTNGYIAKYKQSTPYYSVQEEYNHVRSEWAFTIWTPTPS